MVLECVVNLAAAEYVVASSAAVVAVAADEMTAVMEESMEGRKFKELAQCRKSHK